MMTLATTWLTFCLGGAPLTRPPDTLLLLAPSSLQPECLFAFAAKYGVFDLQLAVDVSDYDLELCCRSLVQQFQ